MIRFSNRQKLLSGALVLATVVGIADRLRSGGGPQPAAAAVYVHGRSPAGGLPAATPRTDWTEINRVVAQLTEVHYQTQAEEIGALERDLFTPTPQIIAAVGPETSPAQRAGATIEAPPPPREPPDFAASHKLMAVLLGRTPLVVVDAQVLVPGSVLDEHRLVRISRDRAVFEPVGGGKNIALKLAPRAASPAIPADTNRNAADSTPAETQPAKNAEES